MNKIDEQQRLRIYKTLDNKDEEFLFRFAKQRAVDYGFDEKAGVLWSEGAFIALNYVVGAIDVRKFADDKKP